MKYNNLINQNTKYSLNKTINTCLLCFAFSMVTWGCNEVSYDNNSVKSLTNINATDSDSTVQSTIDVWPKLEIAVKKDASIESKIAKLLATMTLE